MDAIELDRVIQVTDVPVCRTLRGVKTHVSLLGWADLRLLVRFFNCAIDDLVGRFWLWAKKSTPGSLYYPLSVHYRHGLQEGRIDFADIKEMCRGDGGGRDCRNCNGRADGCEADGRCSSPGAGIEGGLYAH